MQQFIEKYREEILGTLSGFDRLVFRASPRRLNTLKWDPIRKIWWPKEWRSIFGKTSSSSKFLQGLWKPRKAS
jgi:hypothetical protein